MPLLFLQRARPRAPWRARRFWSLSSLSRVWQQKIGVATLVEFAVETRVEMHPIIVRFSGSSSWGG